MDHLMKKSFSLGDLSRQQADSTLVSYKPSTERIVEDRDEPGEAVRSAAEAVSGKANYS